VKGRQEEGTYPNEDEGTGGNRADVVGGCKCICNDQVDIDKETIENNGTAETKAS
jgi:hypothetical protein